MCPRFKYIPNDLASFRNHKPQLCDSTIAPTDRHRPWASICSTTFSTWYSDRTGIRQCHDCSTEAPHIGARPQWAIESVRRGALRLRAHASSGAPRAHYHAAGLVGRHRAAGTDRATLCPTAPTRAVTPFQRVHTLYCGESQERLIGCGYVCLDR